jgi:hypothetical protein
MRNLSFYEQTGIVIPGSVLLFAVVLLAPELRSLFEQGGITIGGLGIFLLIAYALGHAVAAVGNALETFWWWWFGGMPSTWVAGGAPKILRAGQVERLQERIKDRFGLRVAIKELGAKEWTPIFWQIYRDVLANNPGRLEAFKGNYGLNRGLCAASLLLAGLILCWRPELWRFSILCVVGAAIYLWRMHRFAVHFAREVFTGFLTLQSGVNGGVNGNAKIEN